MPPANTGMENDSDLRRARVAFDGVHSTSAWPPATAFAAVSMVTGTHSTASCASPSCDFKPAAIRWQSSAPYPSTPPDALAEVNGLAFAR